EMTIRGHPLAFNPGERVEAGTSPLWIGLLSALRLTLGWFVELPWLAVVCGLGLTVVGVGAAVAASAALVGHLEGQGRGPGPRPDGFRLLPAGALVFAALPPVWDFSTSGLETGLAFGWIGGCQWLLARRFLHLDRDSPDPAGAVVGTGGARPRPADPARPGRVLRGLRRRARAAVEGRPGAAGPGDRPG